MKRFIILLLFFVFSLWAAPAQEITITQKQMQELESLFSSYKANNQTLKTQLMKLQEELKASHQELMKLQSRLMQLQKQLAVQSNLAESSREQLKQEKSLTEELKNYYSESISNQMQKIESIQARSQDLEKQKYRLIITVIIESVIILIYILICIIRLKTKR